MEFYYYTMGKHANRHCITVCNPLCVATSAIADLCIHSVLKMPLFQSRDPIVHALDMELVSFSAKQSVPLILASILLL